MTVNQAAGEVIQEGPLHVLGGDEAEAFAHFANEKLNESPTKSYRAILVQELKPKEGRNQGGLPACSGWR